MQKHTKMKYKKQDWTEKSSKAWIQIWKWPQKNAKKGRTGGKREWFSDI